MGLLPVFEGADFFSLLFTSSSTVLLFYGYGTNKKKAQPQTKVSHQLNTSFFLKYKQLNSLLTSSLSLKIIYLYYSTFSYENNTFFQISRISSKLSKKNFSFLIILISKIQLSLEAFFSYINSRH